MVSSHSSQSGWLLLNFVPLQTRQSHFILFFSLPFYMFELTSSSVFNASCGYFISDPIQLFEFVHIL